MADTQAIPAPPKGITLDEDQTDGIPAPPAGITLDAAPQASPSPAPAPESWRTPLRNPKLVQAEALQPAAEKTANLVGAIGEHGVQDVKDIYALGKDLATNTEPTRPIRHPALVRAGVEPIAPMTPEENRRAEVLAKGIGAGMDLAAPLAVESAVARPVATLGAILAGLATSQSTKFIAKQFGASPEMQHLAEQAGWLITPAGLMDIRTGAEVTPDGVRAAINLFGGAAGAGVHVTPEEIRIRAGVGPLRGEKVIPRGPRPAGPGIEPPTIEAQAPIVEGSKFNPVKTGPFTGEKGPPIPQGPIPSPQGPSAGPIPPVTPPAPMHEITADEIAEVGRNISAMPDDVRAQAMLEAHKRLAGEILQQGRFVGPDGKIQTVTKPAQAEALAQKLLNESITKGVKQQAANIPPPPAGITLDQNPAQAAQPGEVSTEAIQKESRVSLPNGDTGTVKNITSTLARVALDKGGRVSIHPSRLKAAAAASGEATATGKGPEGTSAPTAPETQTEAIPAPPAGITESKPTQEQKPSGAPQGKPQEGKESKLSPNLPSYAREEIERQNSLAEKLGLADKIEELTAEGLVAKQITARLDFPKDMDAMDRSGMVRSVRAMRGIPSQDEPAEFEKWRKERANAAGNGKAPTGTETPSGSEQAAPESKAGPKETKGVVSAEQQTSENVIFGRHGATALDKEGGKETVAGWSDEPLDERGKASAKEMAANLKDSGVTRIITSDLPRAKETADIVGKELGVPVESDIRLRPQHMPETEGKQVKDIQHVREHYKNNPDEKPKGGESTNEFAQRQGAALAEINKMAEEGEKPLVITHSTNLEHHLGQKPEPGEIVKGGAHEGKTAEARGAVEKGGAPKESGGAENKTAGSSATETNAGAKVGGALKLPIRSDFAPPKNPRVLERLNKVIDEHPELITQSKTDPDRIWIKDPEATGINESDQRVIEAHRYDMKDGTSAYQILGVAKDLNWAHFSEKNLAAAVRRVEELAKGEVESGNANVSVPVGEVPGTPGVRGKPEGATLPSGGAGEEKQLPSGVSERQPEVHNQPERAEKEPKYKFGNTQANIPEDSEAAKALDAARQRIQESDLAGKGKDIGDGGNHVTVRYGIKGEDTAGIKKFLSEQEPFEASLGKTEKFPPSEHSDGAAVIVAPIEAKELHRLNSELEKHGDFTEPSFKEYKPHATIAYVDPEKADRYVGMSITEGKKFPVNEIAIADRNGEQTVVKLEGKKAAEPRKESWRSKTLAEEEKEAGFPGADFETEDFRVERSGGGKYAVRLKSGEKGTFGEATSLAAAAEKMRAAQKSHDSRQPKRDVAVPSNAGGSQPGEPTRPAAPESTIPGGFKKGEFVYHEGRRVRVEGDATLHVRPIWPPGAKTRTELVGVEIRDQHGGIHVVKPSELSREPQEKTPKPPTPQIVPEKKPAAGPTLKEGDKVSWEGQRGAQLSGTVRSIDQQRGTAEIDTDQIVSLGGRIPIGRIETVKLDRLQWEGSPEQKERGRRGTERAKTAAIPYGLRSVEKLKESHETPHIGQQELWRARTSGGDLDFYAPPGTTPEQAEDEAAKIIGQNLRAGVPAERLFNKPEEGLTAEPKIEKEQPREQQNQRTGTAGETENVPRVSGSEGQGGNAPETVPARGNEATGEKRPTESGAGRENPERLEHPGGQPQGGNAHERGGGTGAAEHPPAERERDGADGKPVREPSPEEPEKAIETAAEKKNQRNFRITDEYANQIGAGGEITKIKGNLDALELLKEIQSEGREVATPDEQATLAKYVDFGGLVGMLQNYWKPEYVQHYERYQKVLSTEEQQEIRETLPNTHYTSMQMVDGVWKAIQRLGFRGGRVLEPGMGIGNFFGRMPEKLTGKSDLYGVERNPLTGSMAKLLYPDAKVIVKPFQKFLAPQNSLDLIVGNVPFQDVTITDDPLYAKLRLNLHNYFIVKSLDMLRPGGVAALITSRYTMDGVKGPSERAREEMAKRADLVAAIRLPETAFKGNANTYVVADLLIFKKRGPNELLEEMPDWIKTSEITVKGKAVSGNRWGTSYETPDKNYPVNKYFIEHPENVLGEHSGEGKMYGPGGTYTVKPPDDFQASLDAAIDRLPKNIYGKIKGKKVSDIEAPPVESPEMGFAPDDVKPGAFFIDDKGNVKIKQSGVGAELPASLRTTEIVNHLKAAIGVRDQLKAVTDLQLSSHDDDLLNDEQAKLNQLYDDYRKKYGTLHSPLLRKIFGEDPEYPRLLSLENYDPESKEISKAAIFSKRVLEPYEPLRDLPADPKAAMLKVMAAQGYLDTPLMAKLLNESEDAVFKKLTDADLIYKDPVAGTLHTADEYLSGDVREKLRVAKDAADVDPDFKRNVKALEKVQPKPVTIHEAQPNLGATWIPMEIYRQFVGHLMGYSGTGVEIYRNSEGKWTVSASENRNKWNTARISAHKLVQYGLNQQQPTVWDRDSDGNRHVNPEATTAAREKLAAIKEEFRTVLRRAPQATVDQLENIYNTTFNSTRKREFNGDHLDFPGMSKEWKDKMRGYQKAFVWRALQEGRGGVFHAPGLGKTLTMVASGMEAKRLKISPKNLYVVRNNMVPQWREDFKRYYPNSNVLAVTDEDFKDATARNKLMSRIATGDWDAVLLPQSQFDLLPIGPEFEQATIQRKLDDYRKVLEELDPKDDKRTIKQIEKAVDKLESRLNELNAKKKDNTITFDKMGFGMMFVDEAHDYKGMAVPTRMGNLKGLSKHTSDKALAMEMKTDFMRGTHNGRGVIFGTGTPLTNTIGEVYIMTKYLAPELLEKAGIRNFDDWAAQFATAVTTWEYAADGVTFRPSTALSEYVNVPELSQMWQRFAEYLSTNDAVRLAGLKLPEARRKDITATVTGVQEPLLQQIADRGEHLFAHPPKTKEEMQADNWLKLSGDARKISLDPRLYDPGMHDDEGSKVNKTVAIIKKDLDESAENKGTVIVFSDFFEYHGDEGKFNLFDDIRKKLVKAGVPREQIGIIQEAGDKQDAKEAMFAKVRAGKIRVLFGSTEKLGIGVNVQDQVYSMIHLDQPWRPDQVEQREARGVRSGNSYRAVNIYRMISEPRPGKVLRYSEDAVVPAMVEKGSVPKRPTAYPGTITLDDGRTFFLHKSFGMTDADIKKEVAAGKLDDLLKITTRGGEVESERPRAYDLQMYQQLERKAHAQEQFLTGNYTGRTMEETGGDVKLNSQMFALGKAMSTGNPDALRKLKLEHDLKTQQLLERNFQTERSIQTRELSFAETRLAVNKEKIKLLQGAEKQWKDSTVGMEEERTKKLEELRKELRAKNREYFDLENEAEERKAKAREIVNSETAPKDEKKAARKAIRDINAKLKEAAKSPELEALVDEIRETEEGGIGAPVQIGKEVLDTRDKRAAFFEQHPDMSEFVDTPVKVGGIDTTLKLQSEAKKDPQSGLLYQATSLVYKLPSAYGDDWHGITFDAEKRLFRPASFLNSFAGRARGLGTHVYEVNRQINSDTRDIEALKRELSQSDPYIDKLEAIEKEIKEIDIRLGKVDPHITQAPDDEAVVDEGGEGEEDEGLIRGEKGELRPGKLADVAIEAEQHIKHYLSDVARATKIARNLDRQLYTLDTAKQADILNAKQVMEKTKLPHKNDEALYHHLEDYAGNPLTAAEDKVLDDVLMPILEQNSDLYQEASDGGFPIDNYVHRVVKDKGGVLDRIMKGIKAIGPKATLSKSAPALKTRTMMAIENPDGERRVVSIKGREVTMWENGQPTELGELKNAKGKTPPDETFPEGQPNSAFYDKGYVVEGPDGYDWKITQATTKEIEADTELQYYHSAMASTLVSNIQLRAAVRAMRFLEAFKASPEFEEISYQGAHPPKGWKVTNVPQFHGYYFEPRTAEVLDQYNDRLKSGDMTVIDQLGAFMRVAMLLNPIMHPLNVASSWAIERGATGFLPTEYGRMFRAGNKAMKAVLQQNADFKAALEAGAPLQSHREALKDITELFFKQLSEDLEKKQDWAMKLAKALGIEHGNLLNALHKVSSKVAWIANDVLLLQSAYEHQAKEGMTFDAAIKEAGRIIPEYRVPTRILDSRLLSKLMTNKWATIFGPYHYSLLRSFGEIGKAAVGAGGEKAGEGYTPKQAAAKAWDRIALIGLVMMALYPALDEMLRKITHDQHAKLKRFGPFALLDLIEQVGEHKTSASQAAQRVITPAPQTKAAAELLTNTQFYNRRQIYDPHAPWQTEMQQIGRYLLGELGQVGEYERAQTEEQKRRFAWQQVGVTFARTRAEKTAADIAAGKAGSQAEEPGDEENRVLRRNILEELRKGNRKPLEDAEQKHQITRKQVHNLESRSHLEPLEDTVHGFSIEEVKRVLEAAKADKNTHDIQLLERVLHQKQRRAGYSWQTTKSAS